MATQMRDISFADMRSAMIDSQLRTNDVTDPAVIGAMAAVAREDFGPASLASVAYSDRPLPLGNGRAINAPLVIGRLLVAADVRPGQSILLIGAATGYTAAVLARLGANVVALESDGALTDAGAGLGSDIRRVAGPLADGVPDAAPFDRIIIDGAVPDVPGALLDQLAEGGHLVAALSEGAVTRLVEGVKVKGAVRLRAFADMDAVPLPGFARPVEFSF